MNLRKKIRKVTQPDLSGLARLVQRQDVTNARDAAIEVLVKLPVTGDVADGLDDVRREAKAFLLAIIQKGHRQL
jgi:hypothetical protein